MEGRICPLKDRDTKTGIYRFPLGWQAPGQACVIHSINGARPRELVLEFTELGENLSPAALVTLTKGVHQPKPSSMSSPQSSSMSCQLIDASLSIIRDQVALRSCLHLG